MLDALQLELEHVIIKSQLVDELRTLEYKVAGEQLLARIHERRLEGGMNAYCHKESNLCPTPPALVPGSPQRIQYTLSGPLTTRCRK